MWFFYSYSFGRNLTTHNPVWLIDYKIIYSRREDIKHNFPMHRGHKSLSASFILIRQNRPIRVLHLLGMPFWLAICRVYIQTRFRTFDDRLVWASGNKGFQHEVCSRTLKNVQSEHCIQYIKCYDCIFFLAYWELESYLKNVLWPGIVILIMPT